MTDLTMVSLFDGIGGFPRAFGLAGVRTVAAVEIDPAAAGVRRDRLPGIAHFDDVTEVSADDLRAAGFVPDRGVLTAGWPCQDLSVAGLRAGLDGARSGLFWQVVRLASDLRPRWLCLENVGGLLSAVCPGRSEDVRSGNGQGRLFGDDEPDGLTHGPGACPGGCMAAHGGAMGLVLGALAGLGYGYAYRVVDASGLGVPQRRKRVVIVGHLGDRAAPAEVLLEPASLRGDPAAGGAARTRTARVLALGAGGGGGNGHGGPVSALTANMAGGGGGADDNTAQGGHLVATAVTSRMSKQSPDSDATATLIAHALTAEGADASEDGTGRGTPLVPVAFDWQTASVVRRLTPTECERLQGYPSILIWSDDMTSDEHIAAALASGQIRTDPDSGRIFTTLGPGGRPLDEPRELKGSDTNGYLSSKVCVAGMKRTVRHNRIIWISIHGLPPADMAVCHRDDDKTNNRIGNLYLATSGQNSTDAAATGRYRVGDDNPATVLPVAMRSQIAQDYAQGGVIMRELAERYGISKSRVHQIIHEQGWTATSDGRPQTDSARYRQLGNSIAIPVFTWVALGIAEYEAGARTGGRPSTRG